MAKIRKILYIVTQSELGGAQKYVFDLAQALNNQFEIMVAAGQSESKDRKIFELLREKHIICHELKHLTRPIHPLHDILGLFEIIRFCKKIKPDVIHINSSKASILASLAGRICHVPKIVHTVHGFAFDEDISFVKKFLYRIAEKFTGACKDDFIFLSKKDKESAKRKKIFPKYGSHIIYNGINPQEIFFEERERAKNMLGIPHNAFVFGTIANLYKTKGIEYFIEAFALIEKKLPFHALCLVIGEGDERKYLESLIKKLGIEKKFFLAGKRAGASSLLKAFDVFVVSSVKEGMPFSALEAMAAGLPVISTKAGAMEEIFEGSKEILVEIKNPHALANALMKIALSLELRKTLIEKNLRLVQAKFHKNTMIQKTLQVYGAENITAK